ncbi:hypothetical protein BGX27_006467 [Mortierella sp. AM989]|nr:hypothetical protein BGX27_006467 [Mortierella sp. AM989]
MRSNKNELTPKKKSLTIRIDTNHTGPHGMPLVYGSTPDRVGSIKGSVHFSSNYDCKGRDIQIIYEAWVETHCTEYTKKQTHHYKEVFGHKTFDFPLVHKKQNGSTIVAGNYVKEFEIPLIHPDIDTARKSFESTSSTCHSLASINSRSPYSTPTSSTRTSPASSTTSLPLVSTVNGGAIVLPSSNYTPNTKIRYTIRAVLQRPFPSLSNFEASQEIWVVNSPTPQQSPAPSIHIPVSAPSSPVSEKPITLPASAPQLQSESSPVLPANLDVDVVSKDARPEINSGSMIAKPTSLYGNKQASGSVNS